MTRREWLERMAIGGGAVAIGRLCPSGIDRAFAASRQAAVAAGPLAAMRQQMAAAPIDATKLTTLITMFSGPGGNVVVRHGEEGKVVVDTFVQGAFGALKARLDALGKTPILYVINTHWHFDHTDNNQLFRQAGADVIAHQNTKRRLSESHELLGAHVDPAPVDGRPTVTFRDHHLVRFDLPGTEEYIDLTYIPPAHTDGDLAVHFPLGDVLVLGDTFFNGSYPFIDAGTGGRINGMIAAIEDALTAVNAGTKVVPGHGPVADRAALVAYRDMIATVRDRVQTFKGEGLSEREVVARKPTADFDTTWGTGVITADAFVSLVYRTL